MREKPLGEIEFGEPDANAEYFGSKKVETKPLFDSAWFPPVSPGFDKLISGQKFIVYGQKGTGKTAILRHLERLSIEKGIETQFVVFKNEVMKEGDLDDAIKTLINSSASIDDDKIKDVKFYYHSIKRIALCLLLQKMLQRQKEADNTDSIFSRLFGVSAREAIDIALDQIAVHVSGISVDLDAVSRGKLIFEVSKKIKRDNDELLKKVLALASKDSISINLFFDEVNFSFKGKGSFEADASLVRDMILVAQQINEKMISSNVPIQIYVGLREEFLDQPAINQADVSQTVESYGYHVSWGEFQNTSDQPIFNMICGRISISSGFTFRSKRLFETYLKDIDVTEFLDLTWSRPRDLVRFFNCLKTASPKNIPPSPSQFNTAFREYSNNSWTELKSALGAFFEPMVLVIIENKLKEIARGQFDGSRKLSIEDFHLVATEIADKVNESGEKISAHLVHEILYKLGVIYVTYQDKNGLIIYHKYFRGNKSPSTVGHVRVHEAICKALS